MFFLSSFKLDWTGSNTTGTRSLASKGSIIYHVRLQENLIKSITRGKGAVNNQVCFSKNALSLNQKAARGLDSPLSCNDFHAYRVLITVNSECFYDIMYQKMDGGGAVNLKPLHVPPGLTRCYKNEESKVSSWTL